MWQDIFSKCVTKQRYSANLTSTEVRHEVNPSRIVCVFVCCCCWCSCCICCCSIAYICIDRTLQICTHTCRDTHTHKHTHIHMSGDTQCCRSKISDWLVISAPHVWSSQPQEVQCLVKLRIKKLHLLLCLLHEGESWEPRCFSLIAGSASWHHVFLF